MPAVETETTGGLPILSYSLEWNSGGTQETIWSPLIGFNSDSTATSFEVLGLTSGAAYKFRYLVRNEVNWSDPSPVMLTYAGLEASQITVTQNEVDPVDPLYILFSWDEPSDLGAMPIDSYVIEIRDSEGSYHEKVPECDGTDSTIIAEHECRVLLTDLQSEPFNLEQAKLV